MLCWSNHSALCSRRVNSPLCLVAQNWARAASSQCRSATATRCVYHDEYGDARAPRTNNHLSDCRPYQKAASFNTSSCGGRVVPSFDSSSAYGGGGRLPACRNVSSSARPSASASTLSSSPGPLPLPLSPSAVSTGREGGEVPGIGGPLHLKEKTEDRAVVGGGILNSKPEKKIFSTIARPPPSSGGGRCGGRNDDGYEPPSRHDALQRPAGALWDGTDVFDGSSSSDADYIPQVPLHEGDGRRKRRVLVLCTGGTLTMAEDPARDHSLAPVEGALTSYLMDMKELDDPNMPEVVAHEYTPLLDSSDLGPASWAMLAKDIQANYYHFDGFVILMGTDTMAYASTALSFLLENLGKPVVFTGSQIPLCEPYNDARRNLIMALIFASRDTINEVTVFFHDRLLRACRSTKVNTTRLLAFDSPNLDPLAKIGITIDENDHLLRPQPRGALRVHTRMDTRLLTLKLVPGFDDAMMRHMIDAARETNLRGLVLQLYGAGNIPSTGKVDRTVKDSFVQVLADATDAGVAVVATTQCHTGAVMMGHYATGRALKEAGVVSASDMTLEATSCKLAYLMGRGDMSVEEVRSLMTVSLRGEITPPEALPPPPLSSAYQRASRKGKRYL